jgi:hypothetical protein
MAGIYKVELHLMKVSTNETRVRVIDVSKEQLQLFKTQIGRTISGYKLLKVWEH